MTDWFYNTDGLRLLRGTDWVFKCNCINVSLPAPQDPVFSLQQQFATEPRLLMVKDEASHR